MIDFYTFVLGEVNADVARKIELKNAFAEEIGWKAMVSSTDKDGKEIEIDNPITFQEIFNLEMWKKLRETCVAGQAKLDKKTAEITDDFKDLVS